MRFLPVTLGLFWIGLLLPAWSAPPPVASPVPSQFSAEPASGREGVVPATASSPSEYLPPAGASFPVRLPPVGYQPSPGLASRESSGEVFAAAEIIAVVGDQFVLAGDLLPQVEMILEAILATVPPEHREREELRLREQRNVLMRRILDQTIETKMLYVAFLESIPESRREEALPMIREQTEKSFEQSMEKMVTKIRQSTSSEIRTLTGQNAQQVRLAKLMIANNAVSLGQLDLLLRRYGSSLKQEKRYYAERNLGRSILGRKLKRDPEVTHQQMLDYYREHLEDYKIEAKARWEAMSVHFAKVEDKNAAYRMIAEMGNEVLRGAPFSAVAKRSSHGRVASRGGRYDWTAKGSLRSEPIEKALYLLPLNRLSQIIEDDQGFHIIRVLDRSDAGYVSFGETQPKIEEVLQTKDFNEQIVEFISKLREEISVWTMYDGGPSGLAAPLPEPLPGSP